MQKALSVKNIWYHFFMPWYTQGCVFILYKISVRGDVMARPITLFTGQWVDLPLEELAVKVSKWGFDGLELASSSEHFDEYRILNEPGYVEKRHALLEKYNLQCYAIGAHLIGQAVCDPIDIRHKGILPASVWGDGEPEGVRQRAAEHMKDIARAAAKFGIKQVNGFTGSSIWHLLYSFPPNDFSAIEQGYEDFARRWNPIIDVFEQEGVRFGLEVHPTEIAYDFVTTRKTLDAINNRPGFGINFDPSHFAHQFLDSAAFVQEFADRIYHVHVKDSKKHLDGRTSILASHLPFGDARRGWDFVSPGHGDVDFESLIRAVNRLGYQGALSIEWEDSGMDREWGAQDAIAFVRRTDFAPSTVAFDAAFSKK
jgi:sugar phosphate isomerase/epimerase